MCDGGLTVVEAKNSFKIDQDGKIDELIEQLSRSIRVAEDIKAKLYLFATLQESIPQKVIDFINRQNDMQDHLRIRVVTKNELLEGRLYEEGYPEERPVMVHDLFKPLASYQGEDWIEKDSDCGLDRRWNILTS
jgi:hypothetical protein